MSWHSTSSTHYIDAILKKIVYILCWTSSVVFTGTCFFKDRAIYGSHTRQMSKIPNSWFLIPALNYYFLLRCCPLFPILTSLTSLFTFFSTVDWYFRDRLYSPFRRGILISFTTAQKNDLENRLASGFTTSFNFTAHDSDPSFLRRSLLFKDALYGMRAQFWLTARCVPLSLSVNLFLRLGLAESRMLIYCKQLELVRY